jgi:hypothetical protein
MAAHFSGFGAPVAHPLVLADRPCRSSSSRVSESAAVWQPSLARPLPLLADLKGSDGRASGSAPFGLQSLAVRIVRHRCVGEARHILEALLADRLVFTPTTDPAGAPCYGVEGRFALGRILSGVIRSQGGTSPEGFAAGACACVPMGGAADLIAA